MAAGNGSMSGHLLARRIICQACPAPCEEFLSGALAVSDPCSACPIRRWGALKDCETMAAVPFPPPSEPGTSGGPGTELKAILAFWRIHAEPNCLCNARAAEMDRRGPDWCEENLEKIVAWLRQEAKRRKMPFAAIAGRRLVKTAIRRARRQGLCNRPA